VERAASIVLGTAVLVVPNERDGNQSGGPGFVTADTFTLFLNAECPTQLFATVTNSTTAIQSSFA